MLHDFYTSGVPSSPQYVIEVCYHWHRGAALLNRKLSRPVPPSDRDALWAAAALLGVIAFSSIEVYRPEDAWPLKPAEPSDLNWLRMSDGKAAIWEIAAPLRPDSLFYPLADECGKVGLYSPVTSLVYEAIPVAFVQLFNLDEMSTSSNNPYHNAVHIIVSLIPIKCTRYDLVLFFCFIGNMQRSFVLLLEQKDPRALLLLAYWYAMVFRCVWWVEKRARLECQAICLYLEKYFLDEDLIQELLSFPKGLCSF
jgi:hypothetical protein